MAGLASRHAGGSQGGAALPRYRFPLECNRRMVCSTSDRRQAIGPASTADCGCQSLAAPKQPCRGRRPCADAGSGEGPCRRGSLAGRLAGRVARPSTFPRIVAIDAQEKEYQIDYRAWEPFEFDELMAWKDQFFSRFDATTKDRIATYLLDHLDTARRQWAAGERRHYFDRFFGPLSAPLFLGHRAYWDVAVPDRAFSGLRFYEETWDVEQRARDPSSISRRLVYEYRRPWPR